VALAILMELNIRLTVLVVETARLERRGVNDTRYRVPRLAGLAVGLACKYQLYIVIIKAKAIAYFNVLSLTKERNNAL
jgi:hypothetical protein